MTTAWDDLAAENAWLRKELEAMSQDILKVQCELAERTTALEERTRELDALRALDRETARAYNLNLLESAEDRAAIREMAEQLGHHEHYDDVVRVLEKYRVLIARASQGKG